MQVDDREAGTNLGKRRKQQLGSFMGLGELGLGHGLGRCKKGGMGSGLLQFCSRISFNVLAILSSTNIGLMQGKFL